MRQLLGADPNQTNPGELMGKINLGGATHGYDHILRPAPKSSKGKNRRHTMRLLAKQDGAFKQHTKHQQKPNGFAD